MGTVLGNLKPELVWKYFEEICKHPRPSKKEEKIAAYIFSVGKSLNLVTLKDAFGNVIIKKPATKGKENLKTVVLQGHIDMVCEKNRGVEHDFDNDPIQPYIDGEWVKAKGTTLGADNGIGVAFALAVLEDNTLEHGPIECLFTLDEETGLTGANNLDPKILDASILLNIDSEEEGTIYIGCAGGKNTEGEFTFNGQAAPAGVSYEVKVNGLQGGHSGLEIQQGRGNAVKLLVRLLSDAVGNYGISLANLEGGNKHNAIPREAFATVVVPTDNKDKFAEFVAKFNDTVKAEFATVEPNLKVSIETCSAPANVMDKDSAVRILNTLYAIPHGVIKMSPDIPELVETSTNLAVVTTEGNSVKVVTSQRSSVASEIIDITKMTSAVLELGGAKITYGDGYPGWKPNVNSEILGIVKSSYKQLYNREPEVKAIHAGLECGIIGEKYPKMDMVSFGPTMFGVHSPDERLKIDTIPLLYDQLRHILSNIPSKN